MVNDVRASMWKEIGSIGALVLGSGFILFLNLGGRTLENHDYLRYAEVVREMIRSGDWIIPRSNGEIFLNKPPLLFWLMALPSAVYGSVTPMIARLPSFFAAWIGILIVFLWAKKVYGTTLSGLVAGGVLLSSYQYFFQARTARTDMIFCLFILLSLFFFHAAYHGDLRRRCLLQGLSFLFMGLATLTKGPVGFIIPFLIICCYLLQEKKSKTLVSKEFILGYAVLLLTLLPWIVLFLQRVEFAEVISALKKSHMITRRAPFYLYLVQIWIQFFPWSVLIPVFIFYFWKKKEGVFGEKKSFFVVWFGVLFLGLTLFPYRVSRYLLPLLPAFALLIGGAWEKKRTVFLIPCLCFVLVWHAVEIYHIKRNPSHSAGKTLAEEMRPVIKDSKLFGFRLDPNTVEQINFYLERLIPIFKTPQEVGKHLRGGQGGFVLMPQGVYEKMAQQQLFPMTISNEFPYDGETLVLVSD